MGTTSATASPSPPVTTRTIALAGNPNCGKTTVFNTLTGLRAKVGNYPGVTVERKEGRLTGTASDQPVRVLDLPGTYSLSPQSLDEQIARDILFHRLPSVPPPDLLVVVADASNLQRNLYFVTQVIELGYPTVVALNMMDQARESGHEIDTEQLARELGVPVIPTVASTGEGMKELKQSLLNQLKLPLAPTPPSRFVNLPGAYETEVNRLAEQLRGSFPETKYQAHSEAVLLLSDERFLSASGKALPQHIREMILEGRERISAAGLDWRGTAIESRYERLATICEAVISDASASRESLSDRLDGILIHRLWGMLIFVAVMALMFQSIFTFAEVPMTLLEEGVAWVGDGIGALIPEGPLHSLIVDGIIAGVGAVVVFLPQICLLFFFIGLMEDTGYMARAAFLMDRLMSKVGLHGKSFIPMLSSFACAIPGIMATRTIESPKDRLVTILVAPLMSCSARLPVYTVLIAAAIPPRKVAGVFGWQGLTMLGMYLLGIVVALLMAWLFKKTLLKGPTPMLIMELPPYKRPLLKTVVRHMWDRSKLFLRRAGTVILGISIILWFLLSYPKNSALEQSYEDGKTAIESFSPPNADGAPTAWAEQQEARLQDLAREHSGEQLRNSFAGRVGVLLEPLIRPLGYDWKIGIGIVASFAAREVFVSTMSQVYNLGELDDSDEATQTLAKTMREQERENGQPVYTPLVSVSLMVFYVFALQCVSTVAVVRRETNSWKWPVFQWIYMGILAWVLAFITYQGGLWLGWG